MKRWRPATSISQRYTGTLTRHPNSPRAKQIRSGTCCSRTCLWRLPTKFRTASEVTYHGKPLKSHSLGQRASAMMLFLLSQDENDLLLIDQPEDDLDSQTVYEELVKLVRVLKAGRQFIFATHNANFPVLGDSEIIAACAATEDVVNVAAGSIDTKECQGKIVLIMEGGTEAFERRKTIYELWWAEA